MKKQKQYYIKDYKECAVNEVNMNHIMVWGSKLCSNKNTFETVRELCTVALSDEHFGSIISNLNQLRVFKIKLSNKSFKKGIKNAL